jgi:hypothetical protein
LNGPCKLAKIDEDAIVSPLLVICLGLKTPGLVLNKTDELTNMTEKEDGNGKRNSHVKLKLDQFFTEGENLSLQLIQQAATYAATCTDS